MVHRPVGGAVQMPGGTTCVMGHTSLLESSRSQPLQEHVAAPDLGTYRQGKNNQPVNVSRK